MRIIPFITSDSELLDRVAQLVQATGHDTEIAPVRDGVEALDYLGAEMPDLVFINFSDSAIDGFGLLDNILKDPWLLHSSIIAFCNDQDTCDRVEEMRSANIVTSLFADDAERFLPRVLDIIAKNQRILFQRSIGSDLLSTISGSFELDNNTVEAHCYANLLCNYLFNTNKIDVQGKIHIGIALTEMLINAVEHGNCGISYEEKGAWLDAGGTMGALIDKKCQDPAIRDRRVLFEYTIAPTQSTFRIADQGNGFDWRRVKDAGSAENLMELHGRGILMTRRYTRDLAYNEKGNEVSFAIDHAKHCLNMVPGLFENMAPLEVAPGAMVFREGEAGDFLYYIAKGRYDVLVKGTVVSSLSADDVFMGEMSFLLNNRRSASVRAATDGTLIRISKRDFVEAVKRKPHYALFLCRLLAQRIQRQAAMVSEGE
jgi:anti-sigma regulatory factor (Ser/Thr protein kinase)/CheY-like chemotaxis protein